MNLANRSYQEKRNFIRMTINTPAEVRLGQQHPWAGRCYNLSGGGMLISVPQPVSLGDELEVTIRSHYGHSPILRALTKVCRMQTLTPQECRLGLEVLALLE